MIGLALVLGVILLFTGWRHLLRSVMGCGMLAVLVAVGLMLWRAAPDTARSISRSLARPRATAPSRPPASLPVLPHL